MMSDESALREDIREMRETMKELANNMSELAKSTAKFEERDAANRERMDRIEANQKEQGHKITNLHDTVLINTQAVKRISWVSTVAIAAFISGSMGFMFWLAQKLVEKGVSG